MLSLVGNCTPWFVLIYILDILDVILYTIYALFTVNINYVQLYYTAIQLCTYTSEFIELYEYINI